MANSVVVPILNSTLKDDRLAALSTAHSVDDILKCCPYYYNMTMKMVLKDVSSTATEAWNVAATIKRLEKHQEEGTFPSQISGALKVPKIQYSTEYKNTSDYQVDLAEDHAFVHEIRRQSLARVIKRKQRELEFLNESQSDESLLRTAINAIEKTYEQLRNPFQLGTSDSVKEQTQIAIEMSLAMCQKTINLVQQARLDKCVLKKLKLLRKDELNVIATETNPSDIAKIISQEVKKAIQKANLQKPKSTAVKPRNGPKLAGKGLKAKKTK